MSQANLESARLSDRNRRARSAGSTRKRERVNVGNTGNTTARSTSRSSGRRNSDYINDRGTPSLKDHETYSSRKQFNHTFPGKPEDTSKWSRPALSCTAPLRSHLLDETVNTFPKQKSWSALREARKHINQPHISYDINADGVVDEQDYKIAKSFDIDGNGVLDLQEQAKGRQLLSEDFFETNKHHLWKYPTIDPRAPTSQQIRDLVQSRHFKIRYNALKKRERLLHMSGSDNMVQIMKPKTPDFAGQTGMTRSRSMLLQTRKAELRNYAAEQIALNLPYCDPLGRNPIRRMSPSRSPSLPAFENTGDNWVFGKGKNCAYFQPSSNPSLEITLVK